MAYEDLKTRHEIEGVVRTQNHNREAIVAPGAAFAVTEPVPREEKRDFLTLLKDAPVESLREIFSAVVSPVQTSNDNTAALIDPENVIAIIHQGQGGILNSKNPGFHAHVFDREVSLEKEETSHIVSKRTFVPKPNFDLGKDLDGQINWRHGDKQKNFVAFTPYKLISNEAKEHEALVCTSGKLSEFFAEASEDEMENFRNHMIERIEKAGKYSEGQVRIIIENDRHISFYSGENLAQEGNKRWFEDVNVAPSQS